MPFRAIAPHTSSSQSWVTHSQPTHQRISTSSSPQPLLWHSNNKQSDCGVTMAWVRLRSRKLTIERLRHQHFDAQARLARSPFLLPHRAPQRTAIRPGIERLACAYELLLKQAEVLCRVILMRGPEVDQAPPPLVVVVLVLAKRLHSKQRTLRRASPATQVDCSLLITRRLAQGERA